MEAPPFRFPWWYVALGALLAAVYVPTLATPFDFIDDGNLVYPTAAHSYGEHVSQWWGRVQANYDHLGPFRPTLWVHWQLQANLFGADPAIWRWYRLLWCGFAAGMFVWLLRELGAHPAAALAATALAMWNPYRNEIWTSLTLAEGVAMPYALFSLIAARKAAYSTRPLHWELAAVAAVIVALGCKNVFAALIPAQVVLRMWPGELSLREAWKKNGWRSLALSVTLVLPIVHLIYFKTHWHPGQYVTGSPSLPQLARILSALRGAMSPEFVAAGLALSGAALWMAHRRQSGQAAAPPSGATPLCPPGEGPGLICSARKSPSPLAPLPEGEGNCAGASSTASGRARLYLPVAVTAFVLLAGGMFMYLPMGSMSGRYTMPAVWGLDILVALLLTALALAPRTSFNKLAWGAVCAGLAVVAITSIGRQERFAARARMLWEALEYVEASAPPDARIAWISGEAPTDLNVEEGIHFQWHLGFRNRRPDIHLGLFDAKGQPCDRVEIPGMNGSPQLALYGANVVQQGWEADHRFTAAYWLGRRHYDCNLSHRALQGFASASQK